MAFLAIFRGLRLLFYLLLGVQVGLKYVGYRAWTETGLGKDCALAAHALGVPGPAKICSAIAFWASFRCSVLLFYLFFGVLVKGLERFKSIWFAKLNVLRVEDVKDARFLGLDVLRVRGISVFRRRTRI